MGKIGRVLWLRALIVSIWTGIGTSQDKACGVITDIVGNQVTLTPDDKALAPLVIRPGDTEGLRVGDKVWVMDGKIVECALPEKDPVPSKKP